MEFLYSDHATQTLFNTGGFVSYVVTLSNVAGLRVDTPPLESLDAPDFIPSGSSKYNESRTGPHPYSTARHRNEA